MRPPHPLTVHLPVDMTRFQGVKDTFELEDMKAQLALYNRLKTEAVGGTEESRRALLATWYVVIRRCQPYESGDSWFETQATQFSLLLESVRLTPEEVFSYLCWVAVSGGRDHSFELPLVQILHMSKGAMQRTPALPWTEPLSEIATKNRWPMVRELAQQLLDKVFPDDSAFVPVTSLDARIGKLRRSLGADFARNFLAFCEIPEPVWLSHPWFGPWFGFFPLAGRFTDEFTAIAASNHEAWAPLIEHLSSASATRPSASWMKKLDKNAVAVGDDALKTLLLKWIDIVTGYRSRSLGRDKNTGDWKLSDGSWQPTDEAAQFLKGIAWACARYPERPVAIALRKLATFMYTKLHGIGPRDAKVANAAMLGLAGMPGLLGLEQIGILHATVKYHRAWVSIDRYWQEVVAASGETADSLAELAMGDFGLDDAAQSERQFGKWTAVIQPNDEDGFGLVWKNTESGKTVFSIPKDVKGEHPTAAKELKSELDELKKALTASKSRLEAAYLTERVWEPSRWRVYIDHPLLSHLGKRLIWGFCIQDVWLSGMWRNGELRDVHGKMLPIDQATAVRLWHPLHVDRDEAQAWRAAIEETGICQPFKQAHREIYTVTDAERTTHDHSERFAGHFLRQHQLHALRESRGWSGQLLGAWDHGGPTLTRQLPHFGLTAELVVEELADYDELSTAGIWLYVRTGAIQFWRDHKAEPLDQIPAIAFSELMRDIDLFVSRASVTINWERSGVETFDTEVFLRVQHEFDQPLSEIAKTRRGVLERVLPLIDRDGAIKLEGNFVEVSGKLAKYRIHLGSSNVFVVPNNHYLCIVPQKGSDNGVRLPFEGDAVFSLVLSKALLLKDDNKIKDASIRSQIAAAIG